MQFLLRRDEGGWDGGRERKRGRLRGRYVVVEGRDGGEEQRKERQQDD